VDIAIASLSQPVQSTAYIGTTAPIQKVAIQAQTQGQLLKLNVEIGDRVQKGQIIAELDDDVLTESVTQARAQREAQIAEVASAERLIVEAETGVEQAKADLAQAKSDVLRLQTALSAQIEDTRLNAEQTQKEAQRLAKLLKSGVTTVQETEQAQTLANRAKQTLINEQASAKQQLEQATTTVQTRQQLLRATQARVAVEQKAAEAADRRTNAQQSLLDQAAKQQSFSALKAPISGVVMERELEAGTFLQTGQEILSIGDFSQVKVITQVSEQLLGNLTLGQTVQVRLDAFKEQTFSGKLARISPLANSSSRLVPVEVVIPNPNGRIGGGLFARVSLDGPRSPQLSVPETALQKELASPQDSKAAKRKGFAGQRGQKTTFEPGDLAYVFVVSPGESPAVRARRVVVGDRLDGQIEIRSGLKPKERYVKRSSQPLQDGLTVDVSALSQIEVP
jgi:HlyD family secretion protein